MAGTLSLIYFKNLRANLHHIQYRDTEGHIV